MTDAQLDALLEIFQERMQRVTDEYLTAMGEQIKEIGRVIPSAETRLIQMRRMRMNVRKIQSKIAAASGEAVEDIARVFEAIAADNARFAEAFSDNPDIAFLSQPLLAQIKATAGEMANLSRTTIDSTLYRDVIDRGIQAAQAGIEDYNSAIRRALREASAEGIRVTYPSGHTRRLDTAVRQNVLDGIRKLNQANMEAIGEKFGADGVEISAHMMCAEDHLPYQGKQYSNEEFARIQAALKRPFGEWNCRHSWNPIILGISRPAYTDEELRQFAQNSTEKITIDGKTKTRYEWTQEQRKVETAIRYQQDIATAAKASGDTELRREARRNISALNNYYRKISEAANVPSRPERMGTYYGRTAVLRNARKSDTITIAGKTVNAQMRSQKQREHIFGSKEYEQRTERAKTTNKNLPSAFYEGTDVDKLVRTYLGSGRQIMNKDGSVVEYFSLKENVGFVWLPASQKYVPTSRVCVKYAKDGWHAFPVLDKEK